MRESEILTEQRTRTDPTQHFERLRFLSRGTDAPALEERRDKLRRFEVALARREGALIAAVSADFGWRAPQETRLAELFLVHSALSDARRKLRRWMADERVALPLHFLPATAFIRRQPLGVVGIVSPWNYPLQLSLIPLVAAIAAGNRVMLKPSEHTPATNAALAELLSSVFSEDEVVMVCGGPDTARHFCALRFDHLFFTGSTAVGRSVALAAAQNLTPVTLELGGKSPCIVARDADLDLAAQSIATAKLLNAGQTCVAPDYVLADASIHDALLARLIDACRTLYPRGESDPAYSSIISDSHHARLTALIDDAIAKGADVVRPFEPDGDPAPGLRRMGPVIVTHVDADSELMRAEIFGPILPILNFQDDAAMQEFAASRPRPLALYYYGRDRTPLDQILKRSVVGGVTVNDALWHMAAEDLPFGGVGESGMGSYHGEAGFLTFTKRTPVFAQSRCSGTRFLRPPYGARFERLMSLLRHMA